MVVPKKLRDLIDSSFALDKAKMEEIMKRFNGEIEKGLKKSTHSSAELKCFVTYVQNLPTGNEKGRFLALDLGGTNFRVLLIHLKGEKDYEMYSEIYVIPASIMTGTKDELFDHIARCLAEFTKIHKVQDEILPLGFTFSFPYQQDCLTEGKLIKWTKGFNVSNVVSCYVNDLKFLRRREMHFSDFRDAKIILETSKIISLKLNK